MPDTRRSQKDISSVQALECTEIGQTSLSVKHGLTRARKIRLHAEYLTHQMRDAIIIRWTHEYETGILFNLTPVFLAIGIAVYFAAPAEPMLFACIFAFALTGIVAMRQKTHGRAFLSISASALVFAGMSVGSISGMLHDCPQLERQVTGEVAGTIMEVDRNAKGSPRLLIAPTRIAEIDPDQLPALIRVSAASGAKQAKPGDYIEGLARLQPISGPAFPGSYDFSFHAWFRNLGGSGFFMGRPKVKSAKAIATSQLLSVTINRLRSVIESRMLAALPGPEGHVAVALSTGNKSGIPIAHRDVLRQTGLAHILAISGLHMAIVALTMIWLMRRILSLFPELVLHHPVKKWSVCTGFLAATVYLFLSGAGVATIRAWIMISIMLLAVMLDRRAITMRSVCVAACLILIFSPQSLLDPGFQMSFAAVASLVAGYETLNHRKRKQLEDSNPTPIANTAFGRITRGIVRYWGGLAATSLIAGTATTMIAAWHFHQVAPLGLVANLLVMPIFTTAVMPLIMLALVAMPFGFEQLPLSLAGTAIEWTIAIATWVSSVSPVGITGILPQPYLIVFGVSLAILTLFKTRLRLIAFAPLAVFLPVFSAPERPDVLISENGRALAVMAEENIEVLWPRRNKFVTEIWEKAWGRAVQLDPGNNACNRERCTIMLPQNLLLHLVYDPKLLNTSCQEADILLAPRLWWVNCKERSPSLVLKRGDFERFGSHALYIEQTPHGIRNIRVKTGLSEGNRLWSRSVPPIEESAFGPSIYPKPNTKTSRPASTQ